MTIKASGFTNPYISKTELFPKSLTSTQRDFYDVARFDQLRERALGYAACYAELGSGSGMHLIERAARDRSSYYIGFELRYKRSVRTVEKAQGRGIENLHVVRGNADLIAELLPPESLSGIYINFPDPWNKKRWLKHRLMQPERLQMLRPLLKSKAFVRCKTDHEGYFRDSLRAVQDLQGYTLEWWSNDLHRSAYAEQNVRTEFESLFLSKGQPIFALSLQKDI